MKVESKRPIATPSVRKDSKAGSGFADRLQVDEAAAAAPVAGAAALSGIIGLFALQEVPDATAEDRRAVARGDEILDRLDELRRGLLLGHIGRDKLETLSRLAAEGAGQVGDPGLREVLREIELRAQVELAKLDQAKLDQAEL